MRSLALLFVLLIAGVLAADEVTLATGDVIEGTVVAETATEVRVRMVQGGMTAERSWPRDQVAAIARGETARSRGLADIRREAAVLGTGGSAGDWSGLAARARTLGDPALARGWAALAVARDRNQAEAQRLLGREIVNGVWMRPYEAATARGQVWEDGHWMAWTERERLRAEARERAERLRAEFAAAADRRRAAEQSEAVYTDYAWPRQWAYSGCNTPQVIWWGGYPNQPMYSGNSGFHGYQSPGLIIGANGGWGNVNWNLHLNW